jgi:hypothetical protein
MAMRAIGNGTVTALKIKILEKQDHYILFIRLGAEYFHYIIYSAFDEGNIQEVTWKSDVSLSMTANLKRFLYEKSDINKPFKQVNVFIEGCRYITVPIELFDDEQAETLFYQSLPPCENETVRYNIIQSLNVVVIFGMDTNAYNLLSSSYPDAKFLSQMCPFIEYFSVKSHQGNNKKMYLNLHDDAIDIFCFDHGKLLLVNSYSCRETSDRIYFILYAWQQVKFSQDQDEIWLLGNVPGREELTQEVDKYIRHRYILNKSVEDEINTFWK